ncbi:MAG: DHA2 family efflux MFS transporter permease subunit [Bryobacterales bacterium]|nr:DHA2 family efflux MFS transporter permease subunit [Bryobacterales bacterium]
MAVEIEDSSNAVKAAAARPLPPPAWKPKANPWLIAFVVSLAAFMEVLDTSIANVALPHIAGNMGASSEESTWVLTSYLVSNAIVLPITGWLVSLIGRKRFFIICISLFTLSSLFCGLAPTLAVLLLARVIQGAGGGGLQPLAQAILADTFPPEKRGLAFSIYGVTAVVAPSIGPTLGGWITDNYTWRWIFLMNLPVGILALFLVFTFVEDPPFLRRTTLHESRVDYVGFGFLAIGIAFLQIVLDKGQEDDWFGSSFIVTLTIVSVICLISLVIWELNVKEPILDIRLFKNFNFGTSSLMMFMVGAASFSTTVLMPQFLQNLLGYTAESAGMVLSAAAFLLLIELPLVGQLTSRIQARYLMAFGWAALTIAMFYSTHRMDLQMSFASATWLRVAQYLPMGFIFIPATMVAYLGLPQDKSNAVAGLINFVRNIGSSVGTSAVTTILARRAQVHQVMLASNTSLGNPAFQNSATALADQLKRAGVGQSQLQAYTRIYGTLQNQAMALSYIDAFWLLGIATGIMFLLSFLLKKNNPRGPRGQALAH